MKAKLVVNGREFEIEISEKEVENLTRTGYERVKNNGAYFYVCSDGNVFDVDEDFSVFDDAQFEVGNYYSDRTIAENNGRADKLMRQLRRFAVEHRKAPINWEDDEVDPLCIGYDLIEKCLSYYIVDYYRDFGAIYFDSKESAEAAIEAFRDELTWYFTEYKDSL